MFFKLITPLRDYISILAPLRDYIILMEYS